MKDMLNEEPMSREEFEAFMTQMEARRRDREEAERFLRQLHITSLVVFALCVGLLLLAFW